MRNKTDRNKIISVYPLQTTHAHFLSFKNVLTSMNTPKKNYAIVWFIVLLLLTWGQSSCKKDDDDTDTPVDTSNVVQDNSSVSFKVNGGPSSLNNKHVIFSNFFVDETFAGYDDSIQGTQIRAVALWNNSPVYLDMRLPDTIAKFYQFVEPTDLNNPSYPTINNYFELRLPGIAPLVLPKFVNIKVTQYDAIGGRIKGTIGGTFYDYSMNGEEMLITLSEGMFDIKRSQ